VFGDAHISGLQLRAASFHHDWPDTQHPHIP